MKLVEGAIATYLMTTPVAQAQKNYLARFVSGLDITTSQSQKIAYLHCQTRWLLENLITPEQEHRFIETLARGKNFGQALSAMNITPQQLRQIRLLFRTTRNKLENLLLPQQKSQIMQNIRQKIKSNQGSQT
jgi:Spy/CpxP family protein refolding chaperone